MYTKNNTTMKRVFIALLASVAMLTSCDKVFDIVVTQQDIVGTWDFFIAQGSWGRVTIDRYGNCDVCYMGYTTVASDPEYYTYESGTIKVASSKVTIDVPSWPSGTYKIRKSNKVENRYLIDPNKSGFSRILLGQGICENVEDYVFALGGW